MPRHAHTTRRQRPPTLLILAGIALILVAVFVFKGSNNSLATGSPLDAQLDQALQGRNPTLVFLHSLNCVSCKEMMIVVAQVYPEFQDSIVLIDVDVYDQRNTNIMNREGLQYIPTLVFYDSKGERQDFIGVMPPDRLRARLKTLIGN